MGFSDSVWNTRTHPSSPVSDLAIARAGSPSNVNPQMSLGFSGIESSLRVKIFYNFLAFWTLQCENKMIG